MGSNSGLGFIMWGQGHYKGAQIWVQRSVDWTFFGAPMYRDGVGYNKFKEGTTILLEVCAAAGMGGNYILAAINTIMERPSQTARLTLTMERNCM